VVPARESLPPRRTSGPGEIVSADENPAVRGHAGPKPPLPRLWAAVAGEVQGQGGYRRAGTEHREVAADVHGGGVAGACVRGPRVRPGNAVWPWAGTCGGEDAGTDRPGGDRALRGKGDEAGCRAREIARRGQSLVSAGGRPGAQRMRTSRLLPRPLIKPPARSLD